MQLKVKHPGLITAKMAKNCNISQSELGRITGITRVALHRFLKGNTMLRLDLFLLLWKKLGLDINQMISCRASLAQKGVEPPKKSIAMDLEFLFQQIQPSSRKAYISSLISHAKNTGVSIPPDMLKRLKKAAKLS